MAFEARAAETILDELQGWTNSPESRVEGTFEYDVFSTNALEFMKVEVELADAYNANFAQTAAGEYLTMRAAEHGVIRRAANKAIGTLTIEGTGTIPAGSIFATENGTRFVATATTSIVEGGTIEVEAATAGASGNVAAGAINLIPLSIPGILTCTNEAATYDGYDEEDDGTLRERLLDKVRRPATSGNPHEYEQWATSIVGVGAARCVRCPNGAGTVRVVIVDSNFEPANAELLERVQTYIDEQRPVGILDGAAEVVSAVPLTVNIAADITGDVDEDVLRELLLNYFAALIKRNLRDFAGVTLSVAKIGALIMAAGADTYDVDTLKVNGDNDDIALTAEQLPIIGTIELT